MQNSTKQRLKWIEMDRNSKLVIDTKEQLDNFNMEYSEHLEKRVELERLVGICAYTIENSKERMMQLDGLIKVSVVNKKRFEDQVKALRNRLKPGPTTLDEYFDLFSKMEEAQTETYNIFQSELTDQMSEAEISIESLTGQLSEAETGVAEVIREMSEVRGRMDNASDGYIDARIQMALLKDRRGRLKNRVNSLKTEMDRLKRDLNDAEAEALIKGTRIDAGRNSDEILLEIRKISGILMGLVDVPENAEEMYESYNRTFKELQERVEQVKKSRRQVLMEIEERTKKWLEVMRDLLVEVNSRYQSLLSMLQATGEVRLVNTHDIEEAGLEIWVGFKGAQSSRLDPYTHSGGERSTSIMAFLLALQQNVLSPFRAVDEFDLHMGSLDQYVAITPSQITFRGNYIHIIMVHKTNGVSSVRVVEE
jgi:chromosome segregation ATPase